MDYLDTPKKFRGTVSRKCPRCGGPARARIQKGVKPRAQIEAAIASHDCAAFRKSMKGAYPFPGNIFA